MVRKLVSNGQKHVWSNIGSKRLQLRWKVLVNGCCSVARNTKDLTRYGGFFFFKLNLFSRETHYGKIKAETAAMSNFELEIFLNSVGCNYTVLPCGGAEEKVKDTGQVVHIHQALNHVLPISRAGSSHKKIRWWMLFTENLGTSAPSSGVVNTCEPTLVTYLGIASKLHRTSIKTLWLKMIQEKY